jgi:hypothetical protein
MSYTDQQTLDRLRAENERLTNALNLARLEYQKLAKHASEDAQQGGARYARNVPEYGSANR